jgi:hypothetical protein
MEDRWWLNGQEESAEAGEVCKGRRGERRQERCEVRGGR